MATDAEKTPAGSEPEEGQTGSTLESWKPLDGLRREVDRLIEDFDHAVWRSPRRRSLFDIGSLWQSEGSWGAVPAVDIVEKEKSYEVTAELPGLEESDIEVKQVGNALVIKGEKQEEKEEEDKGYYLHERRFGAFERRFTVPDTVDTDKIAASFKNGVLTVKMPMRPESLRQEKSIKVKAA